MNKYNLSMYYLIQDLKVHDIVSTKDLILSKTIYKENHTIKRIDSFAVPNSRQGIIILKFIIKLIMVTMLLRWPTDFLVCIISVTSLRTEKQNHLLLSITNMRTFNIIYKLTSGSVQRIKYK